MPGRCPLKGQSRRFDRASLTSGLPRLADILRVIRHVSIERLENHNRRITGCRVKVIAPSHKHRHGIGFQVHIWLTVPPHENIVVNHTGTDDARNEHARVAIKDAFAAARRQIDALAA
jgi:hypothetical protein